MLQIRTINKMLSRLMFGQIGVLLSLCSMAVIRIEPIDKLPTQMLPMIEIHIMLLSGS